MECHDGVLGVEGFRDDFDEWFVVVVAADVEGCFGCGARGDRDGEDRVLDDAADLGVGDAVVPGAGRDLDPHNGKCNALTI